jgi:hypothetical protein
MHSKRRVLKTNILLLAHVNKKSRTKQFFSKPEIDFLSLVHTKVATGFYKAV